MNLKQLEAFVCVADTGSFSEAAKHLYLTQPTISSHISGLERELNALLFIRNTRGVRLSDKGKVLYGMAYQILDVQKQIEHQFGLSGESDEIQIAASTIPGQYVLPPALAAFARENPTARYRLMEGDSAAVADSVMEGRADIGFSGTAASGDPHCKSMPFFEDELVVLTPAEERFAVYHDRPFDLKLFLSEPVILREVGSGTRAEAEKYLRAKAIDPADMRIIASMGNQEAIKKAVRGGMGITIMSKAAAQEDIRDGKIFAFSFPGERLFRNLQIIYRDDFKLSEPTRRLVRFVRSYYRKQGREEP